MEITEIFPSIQGESTLQGLPCVFVRLTGCNLNCRYCDTRYARSGGCSMEKDDIIQKATAFSIPFVCITGGEPLLQQETPSLAHAMLDLGFMVSIETNGTIDASPLHQNIRRIIDIKCPGSGEAGKTSPDNLNRIRPSDEFKFVLADYTDFIYARGFVTDHDLLSGAAVLLSPVFGVLDPALLASWIMDELPGARLNLQLHRYIWPDITRGK